MPFDTASESNQAAVASLRRFFFAPDNALPTTELLPIAAVPGLHPLFLDICAGSPGVRAFYPALGADWRVAPPRPAHWPQMVQLLARQNAQGAPAASQALSALAAGAGTVVTGQQVGLFGGPLFTPLKAATALARARSATAAGKPHAAIFWLASEDHDFAEIDHVVLPNRRELTRLSYPTAPTLACPVGPVVLGDEIHALLDEAWKTLGDSDAMDALSEAYRPGHTFAEAFRIFYQRAFAAEGLLVLDPFCREVHAMGAPILRGALEQADELHQTLVERNQALAAAGYHAQVAVTAQSSLLFLVDEAGARMALKRTPATAAEPNGLWLAGRQQFSTEDLVAILEAQPERISPSALLRPVFQDYLLGNSLTIGGPAELAYFAQSAPLFERLLGRHTPAQPRFSATLITPENAALLARHELSLEQMFEQTEDSLAQRLSARAMPIEGKQLLSAAGNALDTELTPLVAWMNSVDEGLGRSGETAARKMRYQMNRLRRLAANFQLQKDQALSRQAQTLCRSLYPHSGLQERLHAAAFYYARFGFSLSAELVNLASNETPGHTAIWL